ncbi:MAG: hypothetical protein NT029_08230 [Armatimonadetes bacterium]|nr:hypothetical protein [Armatimonadota bacterium]
MLNDILVMRGAAAKSLGSGRIGGWGVLFSTAEDPDLARDYFDEQTDFGPHKTSLVWYDHRLDDDVRQVLDPSATLEVKAEGVWVEAQLAMRTEYERDIMALAEAGKLGWSSGTASHLVEREADGKSRHIKRWPLGLDMSLTPTPCEPRTMAVPLKSLAASRKATGLSDSDKRSALEPLVKAACHCTPDEDKECWGPWITDLFDEQVIWTCCGRYYEADYSMTDGKPLLGEAREVRRRVVFDPVGDGLRSLAGLSMQDHTEAALAVVSEWAQRVKSIDALRAESGRALPPSRLEALKRVQELLAGVAGRQPGTHAAALMAKVLATEAELMMG